MAGEFDNKVANRWVDTKQAAERLGLTMDEVRAQLRSGELNGRKIGNVWLVELPDDEMTQSRFSQIKGWVAKHKSVIAAVASVILFLITTTSFLIQVLDDPVDLGLETRDYDPTNITISVCRNRDTGNLSIKQFMSGLVIVNSNSSRTVSIVSATYTYAEGSDASIWLAGNPAGVPIGETITSSPLPYSIEPGSRPVVLVGEFWWSQEDDESTLNSMRQEVLGPSGK